MSSLAHELDERLNALSPNAAARLERMVREALAIVKEPTTKVNSNGWPEDYFESTAGALADVAFERPPQGEYEKRAEW